jgi:hypothetical protein
LRRRTLVQEQNIRPSVALVALVAGAVTAFLYTDRGRQVLMRFNRALDDFGYSLQQLRRAIQEASLVATQGIDVAAEGVQAVSGLIGKGARGPSLTH